MTKMTYPFIKKPFKLHWHTVFEILRPTRGRICVYLNGETQWVSSGDCILILPGCIHDLSTDTENTCVQVIQFSTPENILLGLDKDSSLNILLYAVCANDKTRIIRSNALYSSQTVFLCEEIFRTVQTGESISANIVNGAVQMLLSYFSCGCPEEIHQWKKDETFDMVKLCAYIDSKDISGFTETEAADYMGYSKKYFSEKFKELTGIGFKQYIDQIKMQKARRLLGEGKSATEISLILGYSSVQAFSRSFKRIHQQSPIKLMRNYKKVL